MSDESRPFDFLEENVGNTVTVSRRDPPNVRGELRAWDNYQNLVIEDATILKNGQSIAVSQIFVTGGSVVDIQVDE